MASPLEAFTPPAALSGIGLSFFPAGSRDAYGSMDTLEARHRDAEGGTDASISLRAHPGSGEVELAELFVAPSLRRQGVAAALVGWFREQTLSRGLDATVVMDWDPGNPGAISFWDAMAVRFGDFDETDERVTDLLYGTWRAR